MTRIPSLDGMRAVSIIAVLIGHFAFTSFGANWATHLYAHAGVTCFFVISGFLITGLLLQEEQASGRISLRHFYFRRAFRILPVAYAYLAIMLVVHWNDLTGLQIGAALTYLTSYVEMPFSLSHLWSLSCEEQFYLIWPVVMVFGPRKAAAWFAVFAAIASRYMLHRRGMYNEAVFYFPANVDAIAAGCLLALYQPQVKRFNGLLAWKGFPLVWLATLAAPVLTRSDVWRAIHPDIWKLSYLGWTIFIAGVVLCLQHATQFPPRALNNKPITWIGVLSYSLYLWQMPFANPDNGFAWPVGLALAFATALVSYYFVEKPFLRLRRNIEERSRAAARSVDAPSASRAEA